MYINNICTYTVYIIIYQILVSARRTLPKHIYILYQIEENFCGTKFSQMWLLQPGSNGYSYGIDVAESAGLPSDLIARALQRANEDPSLRPVLVFITLYTLHEVHVLHHTILHNITAPIC